MTFFKRYLLFIILLLPLTSLFGQTKGSLFIIGGGKRSPQMIETMVANANLRAEDYIVVLPMATSVPEESVAAISEQLSAHCSNPIKSLNFTKTQANEKQDWIDSVRYSRLIYIVGGDQNKFMEVVRDTKLYDALHRAHSDGSMIAGTSAGAAVMSQIMITGTQKSDSDEGAFKEIKAGDVITAQGMGFLTNVIIDQHFIQRSRYNRLLSVLSDHPEMRVIGIDESTAIFVRRKKAKVLGDSQVVVVSEPKKLSITDQGKVSFKNAKLSLFVAGETINLK